MYPTIVDFGELAIGGVRIPLAIHSFGLMLALAFLTAMYVVQREFARKGINPQLASSVTLWGALGAIVGAKLYSALQDGRLNLSELFSNSGLVWYGGLIGGVGVAFFVIYKSGAPMLSALDTFGMVLLLGYGVGRIGCLLAGDGDYGPPSDLPWAMAFPNGTVPTDVPVHPTPIYETLMSWAAFGVLWGIRKRKENIHGWLCGASLTLAGIERFIAEFWRINPKVLWGLSSAQFFSVLLVGVGVWIVYWVTHRPAPTTTPAQETKPTPAPARKATKRKRR